MNGVISMTSLLRETNLDKDQQEYVGILHASSQILLNVINDVLDYSKIESGKLKMAHEPFSLRKCLEDIADIHAPSAQDKNIELILHITRDVPEGVIGDQNRLSQVISNLLNNAIKFTHQGHIEIYVTLYESVTQQNRTQGKSGNSVNIQFSIKDTGIGIPQEKISQLFQPFSQLDMRRSREYGGTGLGLSIAQRLVEEMYGHIWVQSKYKEGSVFSFFIKTEKDPHFSPLSLEKFREDLSGKRILMLLANKLLADLIHECIEEILTNCTIFTDQGEFTQALRQPSALVIVDAQSRQWEILKIAKNIKAQFPDTPILALINKGEQKKIRLSEEIDGYCTKPIRKYTVLNLYKKPAQRDTHPSNFSNPMRWCCIVMHTILSF